MGSPRAISCWPSSTTSNEVDQVLWNRKKHFVRVIAGVDKVVRILTLYEARSRSLMMNLWYNVR